MVIDPSVIHPEWNMYFHITLSAGDGFESGPWTLQNAAMRNRREVIEDAFDGFSTRDDVESFLKIVKRSFDSG